MGLKRDQARLTTRSSGGREAQFSWLLSVIGAAPLNVSVRRLY
jgi:hypothetical protein